MRGVLGALYAAPLVLPPLLVAFAWTFLPEFAPSAQFVAPEPSVWGAAPAALRAGFLLGLCYFPLALLGVALLFGIKRVVGGGSRAAVTSEFREPTRWRLGTWGAPAAAAAALLVIVAAGLPIACLANKAGGLDAYRHVWRDYVGPS